MKLLITVICLTLVVSLEANFFTFSCPSGCADRQCFSMGCFKCQSSYCRVYTRGMGVCVPESQCGDGKYCYSSPSGSFCTACKDRYCKRCSSANNCQECKRRYELENGQCRRKMWG